MSYQHLGLGLDFSAQASTSGGASATSSGGTIPEVNVPTTNKIQSSTSSSPSTSFASFLQQAVQPAPTATPVFLQVAPVPTLSRLPVSALRLPGSPQAQAGIGSPLLWGVGAAVVGLGLLWVLKRR